MKNLLLPMLIGVTFILTSCGNKADVQSDSNNSGSVETTESTAISTDEEAVEADTEENTEEVDAYELVKNKASELGLLGDNYETVIEDWNCDGVPEVIVSDLGNAVSNMSLYTYYEDELVLLDECEEGGLGMWYDIPNSEYFEFAAGSSYCTFDEIYTIQNGSLVDVAGISVANQVEYEESFYSEEGPIDIILDCTLKDTSVSTDEFFKYISGILPSETVYEIKSEYNDFE